ncbi:futalosine hydrolase [Paenibacillus sp. PL2-23]|uniref:futalosine hydrolase n=1 Tax=Paenibacillus sp. PL2-23 TaxID=2100729 RepID=UPI0030FAA269
MALSNSRQAAAEAAAAIQPADSSHRPAPRILVVTAVEAEREAVLRGLSLTAAEAPVLRLNQAAESATAAPRAAIDVIAGGVGPASAAASTALALARAAAPYDLVISAGIGGGFPGRAAIGSLVIANAVVSADLGAETPDAPGFLSVDELGFGSARKEPDHAWNNRLIAAMRSDGLEPACAPVITVSSATGTAATAELRSSLVAGAASEGMEGFGVATAAAMLGIPVTELRAISNAVGPRDRSAWRIGDALQALEAAFRAVSYHIK